MSDERLTDMLLKKREAGERDAERWAESFSAECRSGECSHTAEEHFDARWHLSCVYLDKLSELRIRRQRDLTERQAAYVLSLVELGVSAFRERFGELRDGHADAISALSRLLGREG